MAVPSSNQSPVRLRFLHGWGFDATFWARIVSQLPQWQIDCEDRGYFGPEMTAEGEGRFIFVTHSFGAIRALRRVPGECIGLVAINGFDRFQTAVPARVIDRMIARFDDDPTAVLQDFRRRLGNASAFGSPRVDRLRADLVALRDLDCIGCCAEWPTPILSLQGCADSLLPLPTHEIFFAASPFVRRMTHPEAGHLLPTTDPEYCADAISAFARDIG